ncbi:MAG: hypothetical protein OZ948_06080 [Deltaproteobacteria bacterium]|nr:hypothetical protein [Deltaproteobacteria bacterium]
MRLRIQTALARAGLVAAGSLLLAATARAEPPPEREWDLGIGGYGWLTAAEMEVEGTHRFTGERSTRNFHKDLGDAFEDADGGFGGYIDGRYQRFVGLVDGSWVQSDYNSNGWQTSTIVDAKLGYRVLDVVRPFSRSTGLDAPRLHVDLMAGARFHESNANADDHDLRYDQSRNWFSPLVGLRWRVELVPNLTLGATADIGGFDIGDASHLTWSVNPRLDYRAWEHVDFFVGWKRLSDDHDGEREVDLNGPQAGIGYRF